MAGFQIVASALLGVLDGPGGWLLQQSSIDSWQRLLDRILRPDILVFVVGGILGLVGILAGVTASLWRAQRDKARLRLKQTLVEQGRSSEEIARILGADEPVAADDD